ncbi:hypothetical protein O0I10_010479 [Lichtheimia ornata]|uniref:Uncharacterized protein n=1 Tax=Lichtheimia ornata TaxID=688661 RepID=A0AAD7UVV5_9FUNG|nr:uncharacterized protein O0I10_010479 [Lichtheimia ornata]KAJ8653911.1 hypothetical protein O0I10_010479 [Lichtheimia ornata]
MDVGIGPEQNQHLYSASCGYCSCHLDEDCLHPVDKLQSDNDTPFQYNYLMGLFSSPDMVTYLSESSMNEDIYALPIHLQRLLSEAKEEVVLKRIHKEQDRPSNDQPPLVALTRLSRVRNYLRIQSGGDMANMMYALVELMSDEDELENVLGF